MTTAPPRNRLQSLTGLRALAALAVFGAHAVYTPGLLQDKNLLNSLGLAVAFACAAVSLFFVLSGFVMTWSAQPGDTARGFWRRRYLRIFPNHLVVFALTMVFLTLYGASGQSPMPGYGQAPEAGPSLSQMALVQVWFPRVGYFSAENVVTWSLACEAFFYLCFPALLRVIRKIPAERLWACAIGTVLVGLAVPALAQFIPGPGALPGLPVSEKALWLSYVFPPSRIPEFILGMLLARIVREGRWINLRPRHTAWLPFLTIGITTVLPRTFMFGSIYAASCALLVAAVAARDIDSAPSWLRSRTMVHLGERSFAFYVVHYFTITLALQFLIGNRSQFGLLGTVAIACLVFLPLSAVGAYLLHRYVEHPLTQKFSRPKRAVRTPSPEAVAG
ncbi:acyltransferase family protein [Streptomyces sp. NPDC059788]|uniref:acyltransferase family protein n=1 Tax=Streptomyces sp. NPDC059788 TaxID=3346948 RepID=UPI00365F7F3D